ncbi:MAG: hypothetical protein K9L94_03785, partial [Candidatus Omnitrophica bacterium]|nr:hypothetical protein [Candidatus Omnitrophota bacterium]
ASQKSELEKELNQKQRKVSSLEKRLNYQRQENQALGDDLWEARNELSAIKNKYSNFDKKLSRAAAKQQDLIDKNKKLIKENSRLSNRLKEAKELGNCGQEDSLNSELEKGVHEELGYLNVDGGSTD